MKQRQIYSALQFKGVPYEEGAVLISARGNVGVLLSVNEADGLYSILTRDKELITVSDFRDYIGYISKSRSGKLSGLIGSIYLNEKEKEEVQKLTTKAEILNTISAPILSKGLDDILALPAKEEIENDFGAYLALMATPEIVNPYVQIASLQEFFYSIDPSKEYSKALAPIVYNTLQTLVSSILASDSPIE